MSNNTASRGIGEIVALVAAAAGLVVYVITSTTGYLAGRAVDPLPIVLTVVAVIALAATVWLRARLAAVLQDILLLASVAMLIVSLSIFILARVPLAADVYFIPVNYPEAEATTLHISFIGLALYLVAVVALIVTAFVARRADRAVTVTDAAVAN